MYKLKWSFYNILGWYKILKIPYTIWLLILGHDLISFDSYSVYIFFPALTAMPLVFLKHSTTAAWVYCVGLQQHYSSGKKKKKISELNKRKYSPTVRVLILLESGERNNTFIWLSWYKLKAFSLISFQFRIENATSLRNILIIWKTIQYICGNQKFYHQSVTWKQTCSFTCSAQRRASWALLVMHN